MGSIIMQTIAIIIIGLIISNAFLGYGWYKAINNHLKYVAEIEAQSRLIKEKAENDIAILTAKINQRNIEIAEKDKKANELLKQSKIESNLAVSNAIKRMRERSNNCTSGLPTTKTMAERSDSESSSSRGVNESVQKLRELNRVIDKYEDINKSYSAVKESFK